MRTGVIGLMLGAVVLAASPQAADAHHLEPRWRYARGGAGMAATFAILDPTGPEGFNQIGVFAIVAQTDSISLHSRYPTTGPDDVTVEGGPWFEVMITWWWPQSRMDAFRGTPEELWIADDLTAARLRAEIPGIGMLDLHLVPKDSLIRPRADGWFTNWQGAGDERHEWGFNAGFYAGRHAAVGSQTTLADLTLREEFEPFFGKRGEASIMVDNSFFSIP